MTLFGTGVHASVETKQCLGVLGKLQGLPYVSKFQFYMCCNSCGFLFCIVFSQLKSSYQMQKDNTFFPVIKIKDGHQSSKITDIHLEVNINMIYSILLLLSAQKCCRPFY